MKKKLHKNKAKVLTERDRQLFWYLLHNKVALAAQIQRDVFDQRCLSVVQKRLTKLYHANWLRRTPVLESDRMKYAYHISHKCFIWLTHEDDREAYKGIKLKSECPGHDIDLVDIRHALSFYHGQFDHYVTENGIIMEGKNVDSPRVYGGFFIGPQCDAKIRYAYEKKNVDAGNFRRFIVAVEYELSIKSKKRYRDLVRSYHSSDYNAVLYIYKSEDIKKRVQAAEQEYCDDQSNKRYMFYYCSLDEVLDASNTAKFWNQEEYYLKIGERKEEQRYSCRLAELC